MIKKYIKTCITLMILIIIIMTPCNVKAAQTTDADAGDTSNNLEAELARAREKLASWSENFVNTYGYFKKGDLCYYPNYNLYQLRGETYTNYPNLVHDHYYFDCVGWVSFAIHGALNIYCEEAASGNNGHIMVSSIMDTAHFKHLDNIDQAERGDILQAPNAPHVAVYLGNGRVADMWTFNHTDSSLNGLQIRSLSGWTMSQWPQCRFTKAVRLYSLDGVHFGTLPDGANSSGGSENQGNVPPDNVPPGVTPPDNDNPGSSSGQYQEPDGTTVYDLDDLMNTFEYSGMPSTVTKELTPSLMYYVNKVADLFDYIIGIMFNAMKSIPVNIAAGIQDMIASALSKLNGGP